MPIIQPVRTRVDLARLDLPFALFPNAVPFSPRSAIGYQDLLESLYAYVTRDITNYLIANSGQQTWDDNLDRLLAAVDTVLAAQNDDVNSQMNDAVQQVINSTIAVSDPVVRAVVAQEQSTSRGLLNGLYGLTDEKLLPFFTQPSSGNAQAQIRAAMDALYKLTSGKILDAVNTQDNSVFRNWLDETYVNGAPTGGWAPDWGGDSGARRGDNGGSAGWVQVADKMRIAGATITFGSTAVFGGSVLVGLSNLGDLDLSTATMDGVYEPSNGTPARRVTFLPLNSNDARCFIERGNGLEVINVLGNPPQSSTMRISIRARVKG